MAEPIYTHDWSPLEKRNPERRYRYTTHPQTGELCYVQLSPEQEAIRDAQEAEDLARLSAPRPETLEEKVARLERLIAERLG